MSDNAELDQKQADAEAALVEVQESHRNAELAESAERSAQTGFPVNTPEGEVLIVKKIGSANGLTLEDAEGNQYKEGANANVFEKVSSVMTEEETETVDSEGSPPPPIEDEPGQDVQPVDDGVESPAEVVETEVAE